MNAATTLCPSPGTSDSGFTRTPSTSACFGYDCRNRAAIVHMGSRLPEDRADRAGEALPRRALLRQLLAVGCRDGVDLRAAASGRRFPPGADQSALFEAVERRIERAGVDVQDLMGRRLDTLGEVVAVRRFAGEQLEHDDVECALEQRCWIGHGHH